MRTDRRADMMKLTVAFSNFANAPKKRIYLLLLYIIIIIIIMFRKD